jgi:hypothetical protein
LDENINITKKITETQQDVSKEDGLEVNAEKTLYTSFTRRNISRFRLSIVDNTANFKILLIDGTDTVSTVLNNSKIGLRKLPVILITFGRKKYMLLRIYVVLSTRATLKSPSRSIPDIPQVVFDF